MIAYIHTKWSKNSLVASLLNLYSFSEINKNSPPKHYYGLIGRFCYCVFLNGAMWNDRLFSEPVDRSNHLEISTTNITYR